MEHSKAVSWFMMFVSFLSVQHTFGQAGVKMPQNPCDRCVYNHGALTRADTSRREIALIFSGGDYADGGDTIQKVLQIHGVKASFFFTGDFYRKRSHRALLQQLVADGHYVGPHSDKHPLYCDWEQRDSLLVTRAQFLMDLKHNFEAMKPFGIQRKRTKYFLPPYEWYNDSISRWAADAGLQLINFTPGTRSNADYTTPDLANYLSGDEIWQSIVTYEAQSTSGLNGFMLLIHIGTDPARHDKFYDQLDALISWLHKKSYRLQRVDELLKAY